MKDTNQKKLLNHIALEDWEKRLVPLFLFKGSSPYNIRQLWNVTYAMYLEECDSFRAGIKLMNLVGKNKHGHVTHIGGPTEISHLCGRHANIHDVSLHSIFNRLRACPQLTDSFDKGFTEYIEWVHPRPFDLARVPLEIYVGNIDKHTAPWRKPIGWDEAKSKGLLAPWHLNNVKPKVRMWKQKEGDIPYPFMRKRDAVTPAHELLLQVHAHIPSSVPHAVRGDLCQDLLVAVLAGEIKVENIPDELHKFRKAANKFNPEFARNISLDDHVCGMDDVLIGDRIDGNRDHF